MAATGFNLFEALSLIDKYFDERTTEQIDELFKDDSEDIITFDMYLELLEQQQYDG